MLQAVIGMEAIAVEITQTQTIAQCVIAWTLPFVLTQRLIVPNGHGNANGLTM